MGLRDLLPRKSHRERTAPAELHPLASLHREVDRVFDEFLRGFRLEPFGWAEEAQGSLWPRIDVAEDDDEIRVTAEVPGVDEKDIDLSVTGDVLTLRGEKRAEEERRDRAYYRVERSYGSFARTIPLPAEVESEKAEAVFRKGVLTVRLPKKREPGTGRRRIAVRSG